MLRKLKKKSLEPFEKQEKHKMRILLIATFRIYYKNMNQLIIATDGSIELSEAKKLSNPGT